MPQHPAKNNREAAAESAAQRTKDRLLLLLKTRGPMTTKSLAAALEVSVPAVRQHLNSLGDAVSAASRAGAVGRPAQTWSLTEAANDRFPDTHSEMTIRILDSIVDSLGPAALDAVIRDRFEDSERRYRERLAGARSLSGRLKKLVEIRTEEGYMAELEKIAEGWLLIENHCPICAAAAHCRGFCSNELELFQAMVGEDARVTRTEYVLEGGRRCAYRIEAV